MQNDHILVLRQPPSVGVHIFNCRKKHQGSPWQDVKKTDIRESLIIRARQLTRVILREPLSIHEWRLSSGKSHMAAL